MRIFLFPEDKTEFSPNELDGDIRLANGTTSSSGRLEVYHNGTWGTVCNDARNVPSDQYNNNMADVVCRTLGFLSGQVKIDTEFGQGTGPIWMDDVHCSGNETGLFDCQHDGWGVHNCDHSEDIGVICSNQSGKELDGSSVKNLH